MQIINKQEYVMKFLKAILFFLALFLVFIVPVFAQDTTKVLNTIPIPPGFQWYYLPIFLLGIFVHYAVKVYKTLGPTKFLSGLINNFVGWFINKPHMTLVSGFAAACLGVGSAYGLSIGFNTFNALAVAGSIVAGYLGDSVFNDGTIK